MGWCLLLLLFDGSLLAIAVLVVFWKYVLAVAVLTAGLHLAGRIQERLERRRRKS